MRACCSPRWRCRPPRAPACSIRRSGSARCRPNISSSTFTRAKIALAQRLARRSPKRHGTRCSGRSASRRRARTHVVLADQTDLAQRLRHAAALRHDRHLHGVAVGIRLRLRRLAAARVHARVHAHRAPRSLGGLGARRALDLRARRRSRFPNLFLPAWQIEGLATYEESAITGTGRLHAGDFRAIVDEAARARRARAARPRQRRADRLAGRHRRVRVRRRLPSSTWPIASAPETLAALAERDGAAPARTRRRARSSASTASRSARCGASTRRASPRSVAAAPPARRSRRSRG